MRPAVVKLGGSLARSMELDGWIAAIGQASMPLVVVPGGGPFADMVRDTQAPMGFSDRAAHAMAILAMEQFGHVLLDRHARFAPARTPAEIGDLLAEGRIPLWLPSAMAISAPDIPASWDITSDSLAAWLAGRIGAWALLLVKQSNAFSAGHALDRLARAGVIDDGLASMLPTGVDFRLAGPNDVAGAEAAFSSGTLPGIRIARSLPASQAV